MACIRPAIAIVLLSGILTLLLTGCASRTSEIALPLDPPMAFSSSGKGNIPQQWWTAFADPELDLLIGQALRQNFNLQTVWYRLREARAVADRESSSLFPDLEGQVQGEGSEPDSINEGLRLGLVSQYEVDLWGRIRSGVDAERFRTKAAREDYQTAALTLSAEVARTWFQLIEARQQWSLVGDQYKTNLEMLELFRVRFGNGQVRWVDILRQQQLVEATREEMTVAESRVRVLEHLLATLQGSSPGDAVGLYGTVPALPDLPSLPETGIPLELVRRRPDIRRAYYQLHAADRDLAAAISNRYPRLTLSASLTTTDQSADNLFDDWIAALGGNLLAPIFDAGRRRAEVDRTEALLNQRLADYAEATLTAFREVEDALVREQKQHERLASLNEQVRLAGQAYERLRSEYFNGVSDYLDVLSALTEQQLLQRDLLTARLNLLEFRIALYRALAGGIATGREGENGVDT